MIYILNFNVPRDLSDILYYYDHDKGTNIDFILEGFSDGTTNWSVPPKAAPGDVVVFMCAKTARNNLGLATSHIPADYDADFHSFVNQQKNLYKKIQRISLGMWYYFFLSGIQQRIQLVDGRYKAVTTV